ncbi:MAG: YesL family protein [Bifidobacterium aquikefiri]|uniref:Drug resistance transporter EmrB/QacA subfamily protein n=1 Tax=Bifidobacterium aquikefiri TaxID=1653207 RepID=A0A261G8Y7_9BIFI|nr:YesL family protein [Bifidobacterium aquikefiri]OZG67897.1 drug resistance transporter EmrB/QacA subfamily protein [Bifidobacterium aquikefiri]
MRRISLGYEYLARIVMMIVVVNIAIIVHTLFGLVAAGFFPSISAAYSTYRRWILSVDDRSWSITKTWKVFFHEWKSDFVGANVFGWIQFVVWAVLLWEYWFVQQNNLGQMGFAVSGILLVLNIIYILFVLESWAIRSHFNERAGWIIRTTFTMILVRPICTFFVLVVVLLVGVAYYKWPGLMVACGISIPIFTTMMCIYSWGKLPSMDIHQIEPLEDDLKKRHQTDVNDQQ